jgi:hypothetical protein
MPSIITTSNSRTPCDKDCDFSCTGLGNVDETITIEDRSNGSKRGPNYVFWVSAIPVTIFAVLPDGCNNPFLLCIWVMPINGTSGILTWYNTRQYISHGIVTEVFTGRHMEISRVDFITVNWRVINRTFESVVDLDHWHCHGLNLLTTLPWQIGVPTKIGSW